MVRRDDETGTCIIDARQPRDTYARKSCMIINRPIEKGASRDGRVGASVGSTSRVGASRGSGWFFEDVGPLIGLSYLWLRMDGHETPGH